MSYGGIKERADKKVAASWDQEAALRCAADNCPRRWSVQKNGERGLCSAHAWSDPKQWPQITQDLHDLDLQKARYPEPTEPVKTGTREQAIAALKNMRVGNPDPKAWARKLESRDMSGERLTRLQATMYQEALR